MLGQALVTKTRPAPRRGGWAGGQANEVSAQEKNHNHYCRKNNKTLRKSVLFCPLRLYKPINKILNKAHS